MKPKKITLIIIIENLMIKKKESQSLAEEIAHTASHAVDDLVSGCDISTTVIGEIMNDEDRKTDIAKAAESIVEAAMKDSSEIH